MTAKFNIDPDWGKVAGWIIVTLVIMISILIASCNYTPPEEFEARPSEIQRIRFEVEGVEYYWVYRGSPSDGHVICPVRDKVIIDE